MTSIRTLIQDALIELGVVAPGDSITAEDADFGLRTLNRLIERWNTESLMIYTVNRDTFTLTPGKQDYLLGVGGDWSISRPVKTDMASVIPVAGNPEIPIHMLTDAEWRQIAVKNTQGTFPTQIWFKGDVPRNTFFVWPVPTTACTLVLYNWGKTENFSNLNSEIVFPLGYEEALLTNLAVHLGSSYGKQPNPILLQRATTSKSTIQSLNAEPMYASSDLAQGGGSIAIRSFGLQVDR